MKELTKELQDAFLKEQEKRNKEAAKELNDYYKENQNHGTRTKR